MGGGMVLADRPNFFKDFKEKPIEDPYFLKAWVGGMVSRHFVSIAMNECMVV